MTERRNNYLFKQIKPMKKVTILRHFGDDKQTLGTLTVDGFACKTLELADKNNASKISCIPRGKYIVKWTKSPLFSLHAGHDVFTYEIQNVPNRGGIRIHSANFFHQLLGCVAVGDSLKDINMDGELDIIHSGNTLNKFHEVMNKETFELEIIKNY